MRKLRNLLLVLSLAAVAATACVVTVWWEGSESSVTFSWTLNGAPPTAASCSAVGATTVRMWISQSTPSCSLATGSCGTWDIAWEWPCSAGAGTTGMVFKARAMHIGWTLLDGSGRVLSATTWGDYTLVPGENVLTPPIAFSVTEPGADAAAVTTWTIDGAAASAATCAAAGAANVYLTWREHGETATQSMYWPCDSPSGTTGNVFRSGRTYDLRWELRTAADAVLSAAPGPDAWQEHPMVAGNNPFTVQFVTARVPDATLASTWTINGLAANAAACEAATGASVVLLYQQAGAGGTPSQVTWTCGAGTGTTDMLFVSGTAYELRWELRTDTGTVLSAAPGAATWTAFTPVAGANTATVDLPVTVGRLDLTLAWADKVVAPAYGNCAMPPQDVAVIGYVLETTTGTVVAEVDIDTEPLDCTTALAWAGVPYGSYHALIDGRAAAPATAVWAGDCVGLAVDGLLDNAFSCNVPMTTP